MRDIARLHGIAKEIISDIDTKFTSNLWRGLLKGFGTNMIFRTTYHPHSYGQIE
jgi:transposase InsO family protein